MKIKVLDITHTFQSNIVEKFDAISNVKFNINENEYDENLVLKGIMILIESEQK